MSYILSALKKAERERRRGSVPDLLTENETVVTPKSASRTKAYLLIVGIVVLVAVNVWMYGWMNQSQALRTDSANPSLSTLTEEMPVPFGEPSAGSANEVNGAPIDAAVVLVPQPQPTVLPAPRNEMRRAPIVDQKPVWETPVFTGRVPDFLELATDVRARMPPLKLTGHLYSPANARARKVIINDRALREGQYVTDDLFVKEIIADGVVLNFRGRLFRLNATEMFQ